jgi:hypothetical protein
VYLFAVVSSRQEQTIVYHVDLLILVVASSRKEGTYTIYNNTYQQWQQQPEGWR